MRTLALILIAALASPSLAGDAAAVRRVLIAPPAENDRPKRGGLFGILGKKSKRACIDVERIAGAAVTDPRTIELILVGGERWRMRFKRDCPALSYYQGFYYRRAQPGRLCAGRDAIIARSGGACEIDSLAREKR